MLKAALDGSGGLWPHFPEEVRHAEVLKGIAIPDIKARGVVWHVQFLRGCPNCGGSLPCARVNTALISPVRIQGLKTVVPQFCSDRQTA